MSHHGARALFILSLTLLISLAAIGSSSRPADAIGDVERFHAGSSVPAAAPPAAGATATPRPAPIEPAPEPPPGPRREPTATAGSRQPNEPDPARPPFVQYHPARVSDVMRAERAPAPSRLRIDALGLDLHVARVGVIPGTAQMEIPEDRATVGWYRHGPVPGANGSAVIAGHVDLRTGVPGPFFRLNTLRPGARVDVFLENGEQRTFEVVGREILPRDQLPSDRLFATDGEPVLTLITCHGPFDAVERSYRNNIVVYAVPLT